MRWFGKLLSLCDVSIAVVVAAVGVKKMVDVGSAARVSSGTFALDQFLLGVNLCVVAVVLAVSALWDSAFLSAQALFLYSYIGRALALLFAGSLALSTNDSLSLGTGIASITFGLIYAVLQCASSVGAPEPLCFAGLRDLRGRPIQPIAVSTLTGLAEERAEEAADTAAHRTLMKPWLWRSRARRASSVSVDSLPEGQGIHTGAYADEGGHGGASGASGSGGVSATHASSFRAPLMQGAQEGDA